MAHEMQTAVSSPVTDHVHFQTVEGEIREPEHIPHHKENFVTKYIFSQDHKTIGKQFLFTGMFWAFVGGLLSLIFRLQLGYPGQSFPILETLFGKWAAGGIITPEFYYKLVTMHGTLLVFFVLTAGLSGTFANLLIPLQCGARDMASPFLNMLSYWFFFAASVVMLISFFIPDGAADGGWTFYPPLNGLREASIGSRAGADYWLIGMALFIISSLLGGLNYITTVLNLRTKGMSMNRLPLTVWALLITAILGLISFPVLLGAAILVLFDRNLGTSFFLDEIFIGGRHLDQMGGNAILYQHLFWFLGHPEVYIIILPAFGLVSEIIANNARKPIFGYRAMVLSMLAIAILAFVVWAHHMFVTGLNPFVASVFVFLTLLVAVPSAVKVFNWLATLWQGNIRFTPAMLFAIGFVSLFISGGLTGIFLGNSALDIPLHDTYFVVAHFHIVMGVSAFFGMVAGVYHWFPKMFGRYMNHTLGYVHFWITLVGAYLVFWPMHYMGLIGLPRRVWSLDAYQNFSMYGDMNRFMTDAAMLVFFAQILFILNFVYSIFWGRKVTVKNPWQSNSLEWTTEIVPGHGNWKGPIPTVYRWPYDYSKNGDDFIPQTEPYRPGEEKLHH